MSSFSRTFFILAAMIFSTGAHAANLAYEITGDLLTQLLPVTGDPVADLLEVPRGSTITIPATFKITLDADAVPFVLNDNSVVQQYIYTDAVTSMQFIYNGKVFNTIRPLADQEVTIEITNAVAEGANDVLEFRLNPTITLQNSDLFESVTVPVNQTLGGTFIENSVVAPASLNFSILQAGALDSADLGAFAAFDAPTFFPLSTILGASLEPLANSGTVFSGSSFQVVAAPVPVPAAGILMLSCLAGLGVWTQKPRIT